MRIGLIGNGGREHAIAMALAGSRQCQGLYVLASHANPGIAGLAQEVQLASLSYPRAAVEYFRAAGVELVVIGPEVPLMGGTVDALRAAGVLAVGPTQSQARLESDKGFMRELLRRRVGWGSPAWRVVHSRAEALAFIEETGEVAVKPLGLTGGKGVRVMGVHLHGPDAAADDAATWIERDGAVLLEERLVGEEFSRMVFAADGQIAPMPVAQDFKYAFAGDQGPMTGGMGAYCMADGSMPFLRPQELAEADRLIGEVLAALALETGAAYRGMLYGQFMVTARGVRLIEFNVRFGDPEAINVLALLESDAVELFHMVGAGALDPGRVRFAARASLCKYLVPAVYPDPLPGRLFFDFSEERVRQAGLGLAVASADRAGTGWEALGSRALALVATGAEPGELSARIEALLAEIEPPELRHRADVGSSETLAAKVKRMEELRTK